MLAAKTGRCVIAYDARGVGDSISLIPPNTSPNPYFYEQTLELLASDVFAIASHCIPLIYRKCGKDEEYEDNNTEKNSKSRQKISFAIGGFSMGGMIAQLVTGAVVGSVSIPYISKYSYKKMRRRIRISKWQSYLHAQLTRQNFI